MDIEKDDVFLDLSIKDNQEQQDQDFQEQGNQNQGEEGQEQGNQGGEGQEQGNQGEGQEEEFETVLEVEDSELLRVLSEKLGREINSFDDLTKKEEIQLNPQIKAISDWVEKTGRPVEDFPKYNKDYSTMSDVEKAREILSLKYPSFSTKEVQLELNKYLESEDDLEEDVEHKTLELKKLIATDGKLLDDIKLELGKPVEGYNKIPEEIQQEVEFAKRVRDTQKQIEEDQLAYNNGIISSTNKMTGVDINLDEGLTIKYNMSPEDKKELPSFLSEMPHWRNPDGSFNTDVVTQDALKIKNFDKIVKLAYQQGLASGKEELLRDVNNTTLGERSTMSEQPNEGKGVIIEGYGTSRRGTSVTFKGSKFK